MKDITKHLLFLMLSLGIWSCTVSNDKEEAIDVATVDISDTTDVDTKEIVVGLTTLESFWLVFQKAVVGRDIETIEALFFPDVGTRKFGEKEYQEEIAKGKVSDIAEDPATHEGDKVYYFMMTLSSEEEEIENGGESTTTIYFKKNKEGEFRIFNVLEAG